MKQDMLYINPNSVMVIEDRNRDLISNIISVGI